MYQDVTIRDLNASMSVVGIGEANNLDGVCKRDGWNGLAPTIKLSGQKNARAGPKFLPMARSLSVKKFIEAGHSWQL
jgi:hypothetical protein